MKTMHIDTVINFPFPTPPDRLALKKAELVLTRLAALEMNNNKVGKDGLTGASITTLGRTISRFPVIPRYGKMLANGMQHGCLPYVVAIVAGLTVGDPFLREDGIEVGDDSDQEMEMGMEESSNSAFISQLTSEEVKAREKRKVLRKAFYQVQRIHSQLGNGQSDVFKLLSVIGAYEYAGGTSAFCQQQFLRPKVSAILSPNHINYFCMNLVHG
jgi:ATP-dependent RNA helicase DHX37/DHR1